MRADLTPVPAPREPSGLATDRFPESGSSVSVIFKHDGNQPADVQPPRAPHRHAYHELIWNRRGTGRHLIDGQPHPIQPGTMTIVGRGQVHVFESGQGLSGAIVRFSDESLGDRTVVEGFPSRLLDIESSRTIFVPGSEVRRLESLLHLVDGESLGPVDGLSVGLQGHLLASLLLMLQRWHQSETAERRAETRDVRLYRGFLRLLELDFARHHDTRHYAELLRVRAASLSRSLARVSGRTTKELVTERVMLEAARLLSFSDLTVGEIAFKAGFADQFYFSRAFKRRHGVAPLSYRARSQAGTAPPQVRRAAAACAA